MNKTGLYIEMGVCLRCFRDRVLNFITSNTTSRAGKIVDEFCGQCGNGKPVEHIVTGVAAKKVKQT